MVGGRGTLAALVALSCGAGAAGAIWQEREATSLIERSDDARDASDAKAAVPAQDVAADDGGEVAEGPKRYVVHVDGAVGEPGVVSLEGDNLRVFDAVKEAGGLLDEADTTSVNLAEPLADGSKIHIPAQGEALPVDVVLPSAGQHETSGATGEAGGVTLVNINTASSQELQALSGVGEATAAAIIRDREANGPFATPEDLMRVSGIGEKKFERVRDQICV